MVGIIRRIAASHLGNAIDYDLDPSKKGEIVYQDGVGEGPKAFEREVRLLAEHRSRVKKIAAHAFVAIHPDESLSREQWAEIARQIQGEMGFAGAPVLAVRHRDRGHDHVHLLFGAIDRNFQRVPDSMEGLRYHQLLRTLERDYDLTPAAERGKKNRPSTAEHRREERADPLRSKVSRAAKAPSFEEFLKRLEAEGVGVGFHVQRRGQVKGLKFFPEWRDAPVKARALGKKFAGPALLERFDLTPEDYRRIAASNARHGYGLQEFHLEHEGRALLVSATGVRPGEPLPRARLSPKPEAAKERPSLAKLDGLLRGGALDDRERVLLAKRPAKARGGTDGPVAEHFARRIAAFPPEDQELLRPHAEHLAAMLEAKPEAHSWLYLRAVAEAPEVARPEGVLTGLDRIAEKHDFGDALAEFRFRSRAVHSRAPRLEAAAVRRLRRVRNLHRALYEQTARFLPAHGLEKRPELLRSFEKAARHLAVARPARDVVGADELRAWRRDLVAGRRNDVGAYLIAYQSARDAAMQRNLPNLRAAYEQARESARVAPEEPVSIERARHYGRASELHDYLAQHTYGPIHGAPRLRHDRVLDALAEKLAKAPARLSKSLVRTTVENLILKWTTSALGLPPEAERAYRLFRGRWFTQAAITLKNSLTR